MSSVPSRKTRRGSGNQKKRVIVGKKNLTTSRTRRVVPSVLFARAA